MDRGLIRGTWHPGTSNWDPSLGTRDPKPIDGIRDPELLRGHMVFKVSSWAETRSEGPLSPCLGTPSFRSKFK